MSQMQSQINSDTKIYSFDNQLFMFNQSFICKLQRQNSYFQFKEIVDNIKYYKKRKFPSFNLTESQLKLVQEIMQKKNAKTISIFANDFLKTFRSQGKSQYEKQKVESQKMNEEKQSIDQNKNMLLQDYEMNSQSFLEAQQLFGKLGPIIEEKEKNNFIKIKQKQKSLQKQTKNMGTKSNKKSVQMPTEIANQQQKVNHTISILRKGKIIQQKSAQNSGSQEEFMSVQEQQRKEKSVRFIDILPLNAEIQKKWNDPIQNQKKGKFDKQEQRILSQAVGKFLVANDISLEQFESLLTINQKSEKFSRKQKIFAYISAALPNRSPQSCYKYLKRNFNTLNRKGKWTEQEVERLKFLVQKYGRKWTQVSKELKRSADNCYDKYRQLGDENMNQRIKGIWKFQELVQLLRLIEKMTKLKFLDKSIDKQLKRSQFHDQKQKEEVQSRKYNSKNFIFHNISVLKPFVNANIFQKINISQVRWNQISIHIKTRNVLDCRNKTTQLLQIFFHSAPKQLDEDIIQFLIIKKYQSEHQINWKDWKHKQITAQSAKNRYMIMKKMVQGRSIKLFREIINELMDRLQKKSKKQAETKQKKFHQIVQQLDEE